jgi:hypothetical protein
MITLSLALYFVTPGSLCRGKDTKEKPVQPGMYMIGLALVKLTSKYEAVAMEVYPVCLDDFVNEVEDATLQPYLDNITYATEPYRPRMKFLDPGFQRGRLICNIYVLC